MSQWGDAQQPVAGLSQGCLGMEASWGVEVCLGEEVCLIGEVWRKEVCIEKEVAGWHTGHGFSGGQFIRGQLHGGGSQPSPPHPVQTSTSVTALNPIIRATGSSMAVELKNNSNNLVDKK